MKFTGILIDFVSQGGKSFKFANDDDTAPYRVTCDRATKILEPLHRIVYMGKFKVTNEVVSCGNDKDCDKLVH